MTPAARTIPSVQIASAYSANGNLHTNVVRSDRGIVNVDEFKTGRLGQQQGFHFQGIVAGSRSAASITQGEVACGDSEARRWSPISTSTSSGPERVERLDLAKRDETASGLFADRLGTEGREGRKEGLNRRS